MSDIPGARIIINSILDSGDCPPEIARQLLQIWVKLARDPLIDPRAPPRARKVTNHLAARLAAYKVKHPSMPNREIGLLFGVDGARVSEARKGKQRKSDDEY